MDQRVEYLRAVIELTITEMEAEGLAGATLNRLYAARSQSITHEELLAQVNDPKRQEMLPGSPACRLKYLLAALHERFPDAHNPFMSDASEPKYIAAIDALLVRTAGHKTPV